LILEYFHQNASGTIKELAKKLNLSEDGIRYHLKKLKAQKKLTYVGSPRKGYWQVLVS
jgi:ATP-dependent DNA helicase RecG